MVRFYSVAVAYMDGIYDLCPIDMLLSISLHQNENKANLWLRQHSAISAFDAFYYLNWKYKVLHSHLKGLRANYE